MNWPKATKQQLECIVYHEDCSLSLKAQALAELMRRNGEKEREGINLKILNENE